MAGKEPEMKIRSITLFFLLLLYSCTTQDICDETTQSELVALFKTMEEGVVIDTTISGVTLYGIREGRPDSLLADSFTLSTILMPLDSHHDFSRFVLNIDKQTDTLRIYHTTEFYMMSYTCGFATLFTVDNIDYSNTMIDSIEIVNAVVDAELEQDEEHLWIYF